jgi:hypothetical protein
MPASRTSAVSVTAAANAPPGSAVRTRTSSSPPCTESPRSPWWLPGTHQGSVEETHLRAYLDEFVFRFNRRTSRSRGLVFHRDLQLAVGHEPVRYSDLIVARQSKRNPPAARAGWGHPPTLERPPANRPRRAA